MVITTWRGRDIEKMSREELIEVVHELGTLLKQAERELSQAHKPVSEQVEHYTGMPS